MTLATELAATELAATESKVAASDDPSLFYRAHVFCCTNERAADHPRGCCKVGGAEALRDVMKRRASALGLKGVRINLAGCLDRCELGPVLVIYPEGVWYSYRNAADVEEILQTHLVDGGRVSRLLLLPEDRRPEDRLARVAAE